MEGEVPDIDRADERYEPLRHVVGVLRGADDGGEHVAGLGPPLPHELGGLALLIPVGPEDVGGAVVDVDHPAGSA